MLRSLGHDTKKCETRVYTSFFDQAKAVTELTQHVRETTSEDSEKAEKDVGETTIHQCLVCSTASYPFF